MNPNSLKHLRMSLLGLALLAPLAACSETDVDMLFIETFGQTKLELGVGQTVTQAVKLSMAVAAEKEYVDVTNSDYSSIVEVIYLAATNDKISIKYDRGDESKSVQLKGLKAGKARITFSLRGHNDTEDLEVEVKSIITGDSGPPPDQGPKPDGVTAPDTGAKPDTGVKPDTGAKPDTGVKPDAAASKG